MEHNFCALCQKKLGNYFGTGYIISDSAIAQIPAYYNLFDSSPHKRFFIGDKRICWSCVEKIANLFGCKIDISVYPNKVISDACTDKQMENAKQYFSRYIPSLPSGNVKNFILYALDMPQKIIELRSSLFFKIKAIQDKLLFENVAKYHVKKQVNINKVKSQNQFAESISYTFGIVDNALLFLNYSEESLESEFQALQRSIGKLHYHIQVSKNFECQEYADIVQHCVENWTMLSFPLDRIKHFKLIGSIGYSSNVYGGGGSGGGVNMSGAIVGGLLFGGAGAIVGSQMGTEIHIDAIRTDVTKHDDRNVEFFYEDENGKTASIIFDSSAYDCLMKLIPEKAFDSVVTDTPIKENTQPLANSQSSLSQLKELKELLDMGIITQEEFDAKKKQLLGL